MLSIYDEVRRNSDGQRIGPDDILNHSVRRVLRQLSGG